MERWEELLAERQTEAAWAAFLARYERLIFAAIRHYVSDHDDVMDVFAQLCAGLRSDDFGRLRRHPGSDGSPVRFSTWLVAVVRNHTKDWLRARDGRNGRHPPAHLGPLERRVYDLVVIQRRSHRDAFHLLAGSDGPPLSEREFGAALTMAYRAAPASPRAARTALRQAGPLPGTLAAAADAGEHEDGERLAAALSQLPADDRLAVQLYVIDEMPAAEVARVVGWPSAKTVYNRVGRALKRLREMLQPAPPSVAE